MSCVVEHHALFAARVLMHVIKTYRPHPEPSLRGTSQLIGQVQELQWEAEGCEAILYATRTCELARGITTLSAAGASVYGEPANQLPKDIYYGLLPPASVVQGSP